MIFAQGSKEGEIVLSLLINCLENSRLRKDPGVDDDLYLLTVASSTEFVKCPILSVRSA